MGVTRSGDLLRLDGHCRVEDAEPLAGMLQAAPELAIDLSACEALHSAVFQVLLAFDPSIAAGPPAGGPVARLLAACPLGTKAASTIVAARRPGCE